MGVTALENTPTGVLASREWCRRRIVSRGTRILGLDPGREVGEGAVPTTGRSRSSSSTSCC
eukprot:9561313-Heterocapsa_arctica.AAC.1